MICTRCELWEVTPDDNFCSWCGASTIAFELRLEPSSLSPKEYPPPVRLIVTNTSRQRTIEIARVFPGAGWVSALPTESFPRAVEAGKQETLLIDVDPISAGSATLATIEVQLTHGASASTTLHLAHTAVPPTLPDGLPYPSWKRAAAPPPLETPNSTSFCAIDSTSGRSYRVRRYRTTTRPSQALLKTFLDAARSLRSIPLAPESVWFAYTVDGRPVTVGRDIPGRRLDQLLTPRALSRTEARTWLRAVLEALHHLHALAGARGPLYHGALELQHLVVPADDQSEPARVLLTSGLYLEHILTESPYSPEYFIESDLRRVGLAMLSLIAGTDSARAAPPAQAAMLDEVNDLAVGATLDFLVRPAAGKPASAEQALALFDALVRAERENHRAEVQKAYALTGSARLLPILARLGQLESDFEQSRRQEAESAARQRQLEEYAEAARRAVPPPPPFTPVPPPCPPADGPSAYALWSGRARRVTASVVKWTKIFTATVLLLLAIGASVLVYRFGSWLRESKPAARPEAPSLSLSATPNPVQRGQRATLNWTTRGYTRVLLDGTSVGPNGFRLIYPTATVTYRFEAFTATGTRKVQDLRVTVIGHRAKPKAGIPTESADDLP